MLGGGFCWSGQIYATGCGINSVEHFIIPEPFEGCFSATDLREGAGYRFPEAFAKLAGTIYNEALTQVFKNNRKLPIILFKPLFI